MTKASQKTLGTIHVSPTAIATIASNAVLTCYGVVGMASKNAFNELAANLTRDPHHGIEVRHEHKRIAIDAYIVVQHGTRITTVAESVIEAIRFNVEEAVGLPVHQVNVYVQGLRLIDEAG